MRNVISWIMWNTGGVMVGAFVAAVATEIFHWIR